MLGRFTTFAIDVIDLATYIAVVAYWRLFWDLYDIVAYHSSLTEHFDYIIVGTQIATYLIFVSLGLTVNIYGFSGGSSSEKDKDEEGFEQNSLRSIKT